MQDAIWIFAGMPSRPSVPIASQKTQVVMVNLIMAWCRDCRVLAWQAVPGIEPRDLRGRCSNTMPIPDALSTMIGFSFISSQVTNIERSNGDMSLEQPKRW